MSWPQPGYPLLPEAYRSAWGRESIPQPLLRKAGLPASTALSELDASIWSRVTEPTDLNVISSYVLSLITTRLYHRTDEEVLDQPVLARGWPPDLGVADLPFATRTVNAIRSAGKDDASWLSTCTNSQFLLLPNVGAKTILDFASVAEEHLPRTGLVEDAVQSSSSHEFAQRLHELQNRFPLESISPNDLRFAHLGLVGSNLAEALDRTLHPSGQLRFHAEDESSVLNDLLGDLERVQKHKLDSALGELLRLSLRNHAVALAMRLGWDGGSGATLQQAADVAGVSRERIRQLESKLQKKLKEVHYLPSLDSAIEVLDAAAERLEDEADLLLVAAGITERPFSPNGVATAARYFGREHRFIPGKNGRGVELAGDELVLPLNRALSCLSELGRVTTAQEIQARARDFSGSEPPLEVVRRFLERKRNVRWLDSDRNWFWDGSSCAFVNLARKILAVSGSISLESLREGVMRHHRTPATGLPRAVFKELCRAAGFQVCGDRVAALEGVLPESVLGSIELKFVEALASHSNVMATYGLMDECYARGVNRHSFWVYLTYSPLLERLAPGVYALRGGEVDPADVAYLCGQARASNPPALRDHGWTKDGAIWLAYSVTRSIVESGVVNLPAAVRRIMGQSRFELYATDGTLFGSLTVGTGVSAGNAWGIHPFIERRGLDMGDFLLLTVDSQLGVAMIQAGARELLARYLEGEGWGPKRYLEEATRPCEDDEPCDS